MAASEPTNAAKIPPAMISMKWCPDCGRDDRSTPFDGRYHRRAYRLRCDGQPVEVTYVLARVQP